MKVGFQQIIVKFENKTQNIGNNIKINLFF